MTDVFKWTGWVGAIVLIVLLLLQRSCQKTTVCNPLSVPDTILIKGDSHLIKVQDTVLKPYKVYYPSPNEIIYRASLKNIPIPFSFRRRTQVEAIKRGFLEMPYKDSLSRIDTSKLIRDYFASRTYRDTVRARDITAVIEDSVTTNKMIGQKVWLENSRSLHLTELEPKPKNKIFIGGFVGFSESNLKPGTGFSLTFITRKDALFSYHFDAISRIHTLGVAWKIHL